VLFFHETPNSTKALYADGHFIEYAVFHPETLSNMKLNDVALLIDRADLAARVRQIQDETARQDSERTDLDRLGQAVLDMMIGVGRYERGEHLSASLFVKVWPLMDVLRLIARYVPPSSPAALDNLDPMRRFEFAYPEIGAELNRILLLETPEAARGLLDLIDRVLRDRLPGYPAEAVAVIRRQIGG
jgi:hypothetical protein